MKRVILLFFLLAVLLVWCLVGCGADSDGARELASITPVEEHYEFTEKSQVYTRPSMTVEDRRLESLTLTIDDGFFFCLTTDTEKATEFVNAQRTLLAFLEASGVETDKLRYYAVDYDDSFSDSENGKAYIALSHIKSYRQIMVTLQTLWGDYTDYGYVYQAANAIAAHLGWMTDTVEPVEQSVLDVFFAEHPDALNLVYPCFTVTYADEETVRNSYALSSRMFEKINLREALTKPIDEQVNDFRARVDAYAQDISVTFSRQENGYAYFGELLPLKIMTTYAKLVVDRGYEEENYDYFSHYQAIFDAADQINEEITAAVEYFDLQDEAGVITINWLSEESAIKKSGKTFFNTYYRTSHEVCTMSVQLYLHGYYFHLQSILNPNLGQIWQAQTFCEMGRAHSLYVQKVYEKMFTQDEEYVKLFSDLTGRTYQSGMDDYFEVCDIFAYAFEEYSFDFLFGRNGVNSFARYLTQLYGEREVYQLMLFPETVEAVTGKTWEEHNDDWRQYLTDKYEGKEIPNWLFENQT